jgi:hypothetical protein
MTAHDYALFALLPFTLAAHDYVLFALLPKQRMIMPFLPFFQKILF